MLPALIVLLIVAATVCGAAAGWQRGTRLLRARIESFRQPIEPTAFDVRELDDLPAPVQRYFRAVLQEGQIMVSAVDIRHEGHFNMDIAATRWKPFRSGQRVVPRRPGFDWDASVRLLPGLSVRVHDAYVAGTGILYAAILGLIPVAKARGTSEAAQGELMRFLAEAVWYPTALLPSQGVRWEAEDERSARATLDDGDVSVTLLFRFDAEGLIDSVHAEARSRMANGTLVPTPWQGKFWNYAFRHGIRIPLDGEVAWLLPEGEMPYWRGHISALRYEFASAYALDVPSRG